MGCGLQIGGHGIGSECLDCGRAETGQAVMMDGAGAEVDGASTPLHYGAKWAPSMSDG